MNLLEAVEQMEQGKYLGRESWNKDEGFICLMPTMPLIWKIRLMPNAQAGVHALSRDDIKADDWKVISYSDFNEKPKEAEVDLV